jgi:hypothetical protein
MAKKRLRDFRRISFTAKTGELLSTCLVDKTFKDHYYPGNKCADDPNCRHVGTLPIARLIEAGLKIGKKRATLDIPDPYCTGDSPGVIKLLKSTAGRVRQFADAQKRQQKNAFERLADEIEAFADRNPLMVLADIAAEES